jgi:competence protein ComFC
MKYRGDTIIRTMIAGKQKGVSFLKAFLDIILPPVCYVCGKSCQNAHGICDACLGTVKHIAPPVCARCGRRVIAGNPVCGECLRKESYLEQAWSCCSYENTIKECIHLFKYKGYVGLIDFFDDIMTAFARNYGIVDRVDLIVPVPMFPTKQRARGYNHADMLARTLSKKCSLPRDARNLKKIRWTRPQNELDRKMRSRNVKDTFLVVDRGAFSGKSILLVDDVYTTGATLNECARMLLKAKAEKIFSLTLARGE